MTMQPTVNSCIFTEQMAQAMRDAQYNDTFKVKNNIYVDLEYIQDFYLGTLLSLLQSHDEYSYVFNNIPKYNDRIDFNHSSYFSDLNISEEDLLNVINDPQHTVDLLKMAPMTSGYFTFKNEYQNIVDFNANIDANKTDYNVYVNIFPFTLNDRIHNEQTRRQITQIIVDRIKHIHVTSNVFIVDYPTHEMSQAMLQTMDILLIMDFNKLMIHDEKKKEQLMSFGAYEHVTFICPRRHDIPHYVEHMDDEHIERMFKLGQITMNTVCTFKYIDPIIFLDISSESVEDAMDDETK